MKRLGLSLVFAVFLVSCGSGGSRAALVSDPPQKTEITGIPLRIVSMTSPVWPGDDLIVNIHTLPKTLVLFWGSPSYRNAAGDNGVGTVWVTSNEKGDAQLKTSVLGDPGYYRLNVTALKVRDGIPLAQVITSYIIQ